MSSVFISYSSKDEVTVRRITDMLQTQKISYFKAPESIPAGSNYAREIPAAIRECGAFILVISGNSQNSIWVEKEIDCAINMRKLIIPIKISEDALSDMFLFYLNNVQIINYSDNPEAAIEQLKLRLCMFVDTREEEKVYKEEELSESDKELMQLRKRNEARNRVVRYKEEEGDSLGKKGPVNVFLDEKISRSQLMRGMVSFAVADPSAHRSYAMKMNAISVNKIPLECAQCKGNLVEIHRGTYRCVSCGYHNYDYFQTIRNFLAENGPKPSTVISDVTGIPRNAVEYFLLEENLEIPSNSPVTISCMNCGAPIRTGRLCEKCKSNHVVLSDEQKHMGPQYHFAAKKPGR